MATLDQLASQIRFQLEQLSERNGHHEFENLCRWLARKRICSNILPATGPVSAFGDQGRDFETFRTYLLQSPIAESSFIGLVSEGPIAFACTLTKDKDIESKIKSDTEMIMGSGTPVVDIHYFCTADVTVGLRHRKLQEWAKEVHKIRLEIHDAQAISEYLTDPDIFWIAERFLNIPAEIYPTPPPKNGEQWYFKSLETRKQAEDPPSNYADFSEIKAAIRHATFTDSVKKDLPFWIGQMESLIASTSFDALKRKATYEIAVASLRGLGSMIGYEERLSTYFDKVPTLTDPSDLDDAATLCTYCVGAYNHNAVQVAPENLKTWRASIVDRLESELRVTTQPGKRCLLLDTHGRLYLAAILGQTGASTLDKTMDSWLELVSLVDTAPLFPLELFADRLTQFMELAEFGVCLESHPGFSGLTQRIDELLAKRHGGFVAAEKCRDRAMVFYRRGEILRAIKEIHKAKVNWFAKEALRGALLAAFFVASCYQELGLVFAAKYYALATAYIAIHSSDQSVQSLISKALNVAASCDYSIGAYCGFFDLTDASLVALNMYSTEVGVLDPESEIGRTLHHASIVHTLARFFSPELLKLVDVRTKTWHGLEDSLDELILEADKVWNKKDLSDIWAAFEQQTYDRPFSDLDQFRCIQFSALGVIWRFKWNNSYELTSIAEEIVAVLQILLADIAENDWYLLRTTVEVEIDFGKDDEIGLKQIPSNELGKWHLTINSAQAKDDSEQIALRLASTLLEHASLLPTEEFYKRIEAAFRDGLSHKLFFGERYSVVYEALIGRKRFESSNRTALSVPESNRPFIPVLHHQLSWHGGLGPSYSEESATQALKKRYENSVRPIQHTLKRLTQQQSFIDAARILRAQGWLDWHILTATSLIVLNYRVNKEISPHTDRARFDQRFREILNQPEDEYADLVPVSEFSVENLHIQLWTSMMSTLKSLGFELHQMTPDFEAISDFLGERYRYWMDDIDHPNYGF